MSKAALVRCPGCDLVIRASSAICPNCMRCLACGDRRSQDDPPSRCGHPNNPDALARFERKFGVAGKVASRDHQHNPDPNANVARIVAESIASAEGTSAGLESAWAEWSRHIQRVDERGMVLLRAAFEAGWEARS